mgnify:CR=1 FL=1
MTSTPTVRPTVPHLAGMVDATRASSPVFGGETPDGNRLLTTKQAAEYTTYSPHGLENLRCAGKGPAFIKVAGGAVAYRLADLIAWQQQHRVTTLDQE